MRPPKPVIKKPFRCSFCKRYFDKIENVTCHITRNAKCSREGANIEDLTKQRPGPIAVVAESEIIEDLSIEDRIMFTDDPPIVCLVPRFSRLIYDCGSIGRMCHREP